MACPPCPAPGTVPTTVGAWLLVTSKQHGASCRPERASCAVTTLSNKTRTQGGTQTSGEWARGLACRVALSPHCHPAWAQRAWELLLAGSSRGGSSHTGAASPALPHSSSPGRRHSTCGVLPQTPGHFTAVLSGAACSRTETPANEDSSIAQAEDRGPTPQQPARARTASRTKGRLLGHLGGEASDVL